jgi:hypothetical protein
VEALNLYALRHQRFAACCADLRHLRANLTVASCEDTECLSTGGCLRRWSSIVAGYVPP